MKQDREGSEIVISGKFSQWLISVFKSPEKPECLKAAVALGWLFHILEVVYSRQTVLELETAPQISPHNKYMD